MRGRLNKTQIQMLLDGKPLTHGRTRFCLPEGRSEVRTALENIVNNEILLNKYSVFIDLEDASIQIEDKK